MDKNLLLLGIGFVGGIILVNIGIAYGKKVYYNYTYKQQSNNSFNKNFNNQNLQNSKNIDSQQNQK